MIQQDDFERFRQQQTLLILLTLISDAVLIVIHVAFVRLLGPPSRGEVLVMGSFFLLGATALVWLRGLTRPLDTRAMNLFVGAFVWLTILFAQIASSLRQTVDSPYPVLMVPAVIAAGFRFSRRGMLLILLVVSSLVVLALLVFDRTHAPIEAGEYFEGATVAMMLVLVGAVVWLLAGQVQREGQKLRVSMADLQATRDRLVAEEKLAAIGRLSSSIAHEIRNPVGMISSSLAAALRGELADDDREKMFAIAGIEASRLEKLTDDFLSYARPRTPDKQATAVAPLLTYVADLARARATDHGADIRVECLATLSAHLDALQLHQALLNLVRNGIDAAGRGGSVVLGGRAAVDALGAARIELYVENSGRPITADATARIFEPFFTTKPGGTGLGLAISRNIALAHGGDLQLSDNQAGRVRFTLWVPAV